MMVNTPRIVAWMERSPQNFRQRFKLDSPGAPVCLIRDKTRQKQRGISIIIVVFLLAVVSALGISMMNLSGGQAMNSLYALRGAQAYFAARSGMEYAVVRVIAGGCGGVVSPQTISGFTVAITCTPSVAFNEGNAAAPYTIYRLTTTASGGNFQVPDAINRRITVTVKNP